MRNFRSVVSIIINDYKLTLISGDLFDLLNNCNLLKSHEVKNVFLLLSVLRDLRVSPKLLLTRPVIGKMKKGRATLESQINLTLPGLKKNLKHRLDRGARAFFQEYDTALLKLMMLRSVIQLCYFCKVVTSYYYD